MYNLVIILMGDLVQESDKVQGRGMEKYEKWM